MKKVRFFKLICCIAMIFTTLFSFCMVQGKSFSDYINAHANVGPQAIGDSGKYAANFISVMMWVADAIALGMVIFVGIKYVTASVDERASVKGMLPKVVIGFLIVSFATVITNITIEMFSAQ